MNITGIITEYNPFHTGHLYHLTEAKNKTKADGVICIMSGNFVQRGGPAIIDKWQRTKMALENGVDLIIELPTYYAVSSAEFFSTGAVSILNSLGIVNNLFFGSECGDVEKLTKIAQILTLEDNDFKILIKENLDKGLTFAKARENALSQYLKDDNLKEILSSSNNILGIEYIKALIKLNSSIIPQTLKREGSSYNDKEISNTFSSATSIRESLRKNNSLDCLNSSLPTKSFKIFNSLKENNYPFVFDEDMYKYIKYRIQTNCINFNNIYEITEGLDNKILKEISNSTSYEDLILKIKSKRYTFSKISRLLTHIFIGLDNINNISTIDKENNLYARVLGFNKTGREMLSLIKENSNIPLITKVPKYNTNPLLDLDIQATKAYSILNNQVNPNNDYLVSPIIKY